MVYSEIESFIPYHVPFEETLLSVVSSLVFKELELTYPRISLSEMVEKPQYGYTASASWEPIGVRLVRITDIQAGRIDWDSVPYCKCDNPNKYLLKEDDILFARTGGTTGKSIIVKDEIPPSIFASYLIRVRSRKGVSPDFLYWFFQTKQYWSQIKTEKKGSAQPNVNGRRLALLKISSPEIEVQEVVVKYLDSYRSKVYGESTELSSLPTVIKAAERKASKIHRLMIRIEEVVRLRAKASSELEMLLKNSLRKIFLDMRIQAVPLGKVCRTTSGGTPSRNRPDYFKGTIPWLKSGELNDRLILDSEEHITKEALQNSNAKVFPKGTLLVALYGATVGKTGILGIDASTNQAICALFPNEKMLKRSYLHWFLQYKRDDFLYRRFGGAQPNISQRLLRRTNIPLPSLSVQQDIIAYLDSLQEKIDKTRKIQDEVQEDVEKLIPSLLDKAFKSEL